MNHVVKLEENIRSKKQGNNQFKELLLHLRNGECTISDWELLNSCNISNFSSNEVKKITTRLANTNKSVLAHSYNMLLKNGQPLITIKANHNSKKANKLSSYEFGGLEPILCVNVAAKVMHTRNLWARYGLCNGAMGVVKTVIYKDGPYPPSLPIAVLVVFENYKGRMVDGYCVPVIPIVSNSNTLENLERIPVPLKLSWGITIHKSQRLTIPNAVIDIGPKENVAGLAYVAISRVCKLPYLIMEPTTLDRLNAVRQTKNFQFRVKEEERLDKISKDTLRKYAGIFET